MKISQFTLKILLLAVCVLFATAVCRPVRTFSQTIMDFPSSPNPVGSGARALGMGGAFIAVADDATAASWNPGGLTQLNKAEISVVWGGVHRIENNAFGIQPEADGSNTVSVWDRVNYLSFSYPLNLLDQRMTVSLSYQNLYDFSRRWVFSLKELSDDYEIWDTNVDYDLDGSLSAFGIACAVRTQWLPQVSFGFTANLWEDGLHKNGWDAIQIQQDNIRNKDTGAQSVFEYRSNDHYSFSGLNFNLGILWDINANFTVGAVLKTPFKADLRHEVDREMFFTNIEARESKERKEDGNKDETKDETLEMPISYGVGMAYRASDEFTLSFDIYRTRWDEFVREDEDGNRFSPVTGKPVSESKIDPTWQVRMGAEYHFIDPFGLDAVIPLCAGAFYDPAPAEGDPDNYFGFTLGSGFMDGKCYTFDIAYQYRFGNNVGSSIMQDKEFSQNIREHTVYTSLIIYF